MLDVFQLIVLILGLSSFIKETETDGTEVIITAAGMAAALPGVVASQTVLPVIGVPIKWLQH